MALAGSASAQVCPPGATLENEADCGLPDDTINGGCNSVPAVFGSISNGETICGTAAFDDVLGSRDTDWFEFVLTEASTVTLTTYTEFDALVGFVGGNGTPGCAGTTGSISPAGFPFAFETIDVTTILPAGTYYAFVAPQFGLPVLCGTPYTATLTTETFVPTPPAVFTDLGVIGNSSALVTLDLCLSDFDTELGIYNNDGGLVANNDDSCGLGSSITTGLTAGTYWAAVTGFNTTFGQFWVASGSGRDFGNFGGTFGSVGVSGFLGTDEVSWYRFDIEEGGGITPPPAIDLGDVATVSDIFSIDSYGSTFDTELGLWNSAGALLANNDDAGGTLQSELPNLNLAEGTYYFSISAFNTTFAPFFSAVSTSSQSGQASGFVNGTFWDTFIDPGEVQFYSFNVTDGAAPCVGDIADVFGSLGADGEVEFGDFLALLGLIGPCPGGTPGCVGDIADIFGGIGGDGEVEFGDFLALLGLIGPCP